MGNFSVTDTGFNTTTSILVFSSNGNISVSKLVVSRGVIYVFLQITTPSEERRDDEKLYHSLTLAQLDRKYAFVGHIAIAQIEHLPRH